MKKKTLLLLLFMIQHISNMQSCMLWWTLMHKGTARIFAYMYIYYYFVIVSPTSAKEFV